ncbi:MAG: molybdenum cofactor biosynthesis protein MoaE [Pontixanthobacter sp.]
MTALQDCVLTADSFDPAYKLSKFRQAHVDSGAIASFTGVARAIAKDGVPISALHLECHPRLTLSSMQAIRRDALERFDLAGAYIIHRYGSIAPNEPIVWVAAAAPHRRSALDAVDCMMDRLKTEAVFWKREEGVTGSRWIEPTAADYTAVERWR